MKGLMRFNTISKEKIMIALLFVIPLWIVAAVFRHGLFMATGEEGLFLYNPEIILNKFLSVWYEVGTGYQIPVLLPRLTFVWTFGLLYKVIPLVFVQALFFLILMEIGVVGSYYLVKEITKNKSIAFFAGLFYLLNLYTQSQIWGRFLYTGFFTWAYLPIFLFLWIKLLKDKKLVWILLFLFSSVPFSTSFGHPADIFTLFIPILIYLMSKLWSARRKLVQLLTLLFYSLVVFIGWMIINLWWLYPYLRLGDTAFSEVSGWKKNLDNLLSVSNYYPNRALLLLRQDFLFGPGSSYPSYYSFWGVYLISIIILLLVVIGIIISRRKHYFGYVMSFLLLSWFLAKGTNVPFGYSFYKLLFTVLPITQSLRNPYEKLGADFLLPYSIFFAVGLCWVYQKIGNSKKFFLLLFISFGVLVWPLWTGNTYSDSIRVKVPSYYEEVNQFINQDKSDGRILMLPILPGDAVGYTWGYKGVEPSEFLFDRPAISKILRTKYYDDKYTDLYNRFTLGDDYNELLGEMNVKYLILRDDLDSKASSASSSAQVINQLKQNGRIKFIKDFGALSVYEYTPNATAALFVVDNEDGILISYQKIHPTFYQVQVKNASRPYDLIFKSTFDKLWQARINKEAIREHFVSYNFANGWKINKVGDYTIDIMFKIWPWE